MIFSWTQVTATTETGTGRPGYGPEKAADGNVTSYWMGDFDVGAVAEPVINSEAKLYSISVDSDGVWFVEIRRRVKIQDTLNASAQGMTVHV